MMKFRKYFLMCVILIFLIANFSQLLSAEVNVYTVNNLKNLTKDRKEIILYRIDMSGDVQIIQTEISLDEDQKENMIISEKCKELFENDEILQNSLNKNGDNIQWIEVMSQGKGFHFSFRKIWLTDRNVSWRTIIKYRYFFELDYTKIRLNENEDWKYLLNGSQKIRLKGFTGYIYFEPKGFWGNTTIHGYTLSIEWATPRWPKY